MILALVKQRYDVGIVFRYARVEKVSFGLIKEASAAIICALPGIREACNFVST
jgi:hypothetical protein